MERYVNENRATGQGPTGEARAEAVPAASVGHHRRPNGTAWGPRCHDVLSDEQLRRISRLALVLGEPCPLTLDRWIDGFCRDPVPEDEITLLEAIAVVYKKLAVRCLLEEREKQSLYAAIVATTCEAGVDDLEQQLPAQLAETVTINRVGAMLADALSRRERP